MKIIDVVRCIEEIAPLGIQESYDNSGLIIGDKENEIRKILICLDVTEDIIDEAVLKNCDFIISHHPIIFTPLKKIQGSNHIERIIIKAIKNNIAIYASHTSLDNAEKGLNDFIAQRIGLKNTSVLSPMKSSLRKIVTFCPLEHSGIVRTAILEAGAGKIGNYDFCSFNVEGKGSFRASDNASPFVGNKNEMHFENEVKIEAVYPFYLEDKIVEALLNAHPYEEVAYDIIPLENKLKTVGAGILGSLEKSMPAVDFFNFLKDRLSLNVIKYSSYDCNKEIKNVAFCGGSGSFLINDATAKKADILISSEFKYNHYLEVKNKIIIADIGHYESEQYSKELIYEVINKKFPTFAVEISEKDKNSVNYF